MSLIFDVAYEEETELPLCMIPLAMLSTALTHLFGGSAGREGVAVQIGAVFSYFAGKNYRLKRARYLSGNRYGCRLCGHVPERRLQL